ncbi:MAG TPA: YggT family protein [bacterium]|nr:MAG: YGGT family protein [bacterium ADurb.Bin270]HPW45425.1 YggT family protein [bacterium]HQH80240.1 YggT family protein [bacterium]
MPFLASIIMGIAKLFGLAINIYTMIVIVAALISWVSPDPYNPIVRMLQTLTEPAFRFIRRLLPIRLRMLRIDISPIILLLFLTIAEAVLMRLFHMAAAAIVAP